MTLALCLLVAGVALKLLGRWADHRLRELDERQAWIDKTCFCSIFQPCSCGKRHQEGQVTESDFLGFKDSPCDEHRTCGAYARCLDCMQDCSLNEPCKGCEVTLLKAYIAVLEDRVHGALMPGLTKAEFARRYSLYYGPNEDDWICNVCGSRREAVDVTPSPDAPDMFAPGYCPNRHLHP